MSADEDTYTGGRTLKNKANSARARTEVDQHKIKMFETTWSTLTQEYDILHYSTIFCHIPYPSTIVTILQDQTRDCQA